MMRWISSLFTAPATTLPPIITVTPAEADPIIDDQATDKSISYELLDELSKFENRLHVKIGSLEGKLEELEQCKVILLGEMPVTFHEQVHPSDDARKMAALCQQVFLKLKGYVKPAEKELAELMAMVRPEIQQLSQHINDLVQKIHEPHTKALTESHLLSDEEKSLLALDICNTGIMLATELKELLVNILDELVLCTTSEKWAEVGLNFALELMIFLATNHSLGVKLTFEKPYRNDLNTRIKNAKLEIDLLETDGEGKLKLSLNTLKEMLVVLQASVNAPVMSDHSASVATQGMFAAKPVAVHPAAAMSFTP